MNPGIEKRGARRALRTWLGAGALALAAVGLAGCSNDLMPLINDTPYNRDCCVNGELYYVCNDQLSYGQCSDSIQTTSIPSGCTLQANLPCPATTTSP